MYDVVLLTLGSERDAPGACGSGGACCGGAGEEKAEQTGERCETPRVPVLACADALTAGGARVETVTARSDAEIDEVLARLDGPARPDGLTWPDPDSKTRLVVAAASDTQLRAVLRRLVRRYAPPPSRRPEDLAVGRTVPDLPPVGVLPLDPAGSTGHRDLAAQLGLPRDPAAVAAAVLDGTPAASTCCATTAAPSPWTARCSARPTTPAGRCTGGAGWRWTTPSSPTATNRCWPAPSATPAGTHPSAMWPCWPHGPGRRPGRGRRGGPGGGPLPLRAQTGTPRGAPRPRPRRRGCCHVTRRCRSWTTAPRAS